MVILGFISIFRISSFTRPSRSTLGSLMELMCRRSRRKKRRRERVKRKEMRKKKKRKRKKKKRMKMRKKKKRGNVVLFFLRIKAEKLKFRIEPTKGLVRCRERKCLR